MVDIKPLRYLFILRLVVYSHRSSEYPHGVVELSGVDGTATMWRSIRPACYAGDSTGFEQYFHPALRFCADWRWLTSQAALNFITVCIYIYIYTSLSWMSVLDGTFTALLLPFRELLTVAFSLD